MQLYYYKCPTGNFGDELNPWLWPRLLPGLLDDDPATLFLGIGTLLNHRVPAAPRKIVFGTGAGYGDMPHLDERWSFYCVRGPLTARKLGLDARLAVTDAAALIARLDLPPRSRDGGIAYMPHIDSTLRADWAAVCTAAGVRYIDPAADVDTVLAHIQRSRVLLTEAMHGAIVADALRVPWVPVACYRHVLEFKWQDWCASLGLDYAPARLPRLWNAERRLAWRARLKNRVKRALMSAGYHRRDWTPPPPPVSDRSRFELVVSELAALARNPIPRLSTDRRLEQATARLAELLDRLRRDVQPARPTIRASNTATAWSPPLDG